LCWSGCRSFERPAIELTIEVDRSVDQGQVREGLLEVTELIAGLPDIRPCAAIGG